MYLYRYSGFTIYHTCQYKELEKCKHMNLLNDNYRYHYRTAFVCSSLQCSFLQRGFILLNEDTVID